MSKLTWDAIGEHYFETGIDHGVLYPMDHNGRYPLGVAWNGLTSVSENPSGADANKQWADNLNYLTIYGAEEFGATIEAFTYPDEWEECDGHLNFAQGASIGQQTRKSFGLSYRTKIGNDTVGQDLGYKLHLIYGGRAAPSERDYETINDSPEPITFSWEITTTPVMVDGFKPISTIEIDSRDFVTNEDKAKLSALEDALYGTDDTVPYLPSPDEVKHILGFRENEVDWGIFDEDTAPFVLTFRLPAEIDVSNYNSNNALTAKSLGLSSLEDVENFINNTKLSGNIKFYHSATKTLLYDKDFFDIPYSSFYLMANNGSGVVIEEGTRDLIYNKFIVPNEFNKNGLSALDHALMDRWIPKYPDDEEIYEAVYNNIKIPDDSTAYSINVKLPKEGIKRPNWIVPIPAKELRQTYSYDFDGDTAIHTSKYHDFFDSSTGSLESGIFKGAIPAGPNVPQAPFYNYTSNGIDGLLNQFKIVLHISTPDLEGTWSNGAIVTGSATIGRSNVDLYNPNSPKQARLAISYTGNWIPRSDDIDWNSFDSDNIPMLVAVKPSQAIINGLAGSQDNPNPNSNPVTNVENGHLNILNMIKWGKPIFSLNLNGFIKDDIMQSMELVTWLTCGKSNDSSTAISDSIQNPDRPCIGLASTIKSYKTKYYNDSSGIGKPLGIAKVPVYILWENPIASSSRRDLVYEDTEIGPISVSDDFLFSESVTADSTYGYLVYKSSSSHSFFTQIKGEMCYTSTQVPNAPNNLRLTQTGSNSIEIYTSSDIPYDPKNPEANRMAIVLCDLS